MINEIIHGDCLDVMLDIKTESIDMILCDLPYGVTRNKWDSVIPLDQLWREYERIIKPCGVIALTASQPFASQLVVSKQELFKHEWVWIKHKGSNFANTVREPMKEHELVLIFSRGNWTYNRQMQERSEKGKERSKHKVNYHTTTDNYGSFSRKENNNISELRVPSSWQKFNCETGLHPTQKPVPLFEYIIKTYTNEGDTVLDNCIGSGTTAVAAINTGRNFIGIEKDCSYVDVARRRIGFIQQLINF